jgi:CheY-like chemotaxis protein
MSPPPLRSVLVVDDYVDALEMVGEYLAFRGYHVRLASTGRQALDLAHAECPDIILLDLQMPGMNGIEVLHLLRSDAAFASTPIVALTAHALESERAAAEREGFDAFIAKPCLPDELVSLMETIFAARADAAAQSRVS